MNGDPTDPSIDPVEPPAGRRRLLIQGGLLLVAAGTAVSMVLPEGWAADAAMGLALVGFVAVVIGWR